ncbi:MAG: GNAT family N-acetyltransferase, partial [Anaerolineales bacterium]
MTLPQFFIRLYEPHDFSAALAAVQASAEADGIPRIPAADFQNRLSLTNLEPGLEAADDAWVAVAPGTGVVAYADGWLVGEGANRIYRGECWVQPSFRQRGIGRALLARQWARAKYIAAFLSRRSGAATTIGLRAQAWQSLPAARALLESAQMAPVREFLEMTRGLAARLPNAATPPDITLRRWSERRADEALWVAQNAGFAEHWGYQHQTYEAFAQRIETRHAEPENSTIAWAGDVIAGACLNAFGPTAAARLGRGRGRVNQIFVL